MLFSGAAKERDRIVHAAKWEQISQLLQSASTPQKAAISLVYELPWLMPEDSEFSPQKIYRHFAVDDENALKQLVDGWLAELA